MIQKNKQNNEYNHFNKFANEWWVSDGKFKILHTITPLRIEYIKNNLRKTSKNIKKPIKELLNLDILDLGCGGGLVCEPLSRLGANVTGIDFINKNIEVAKKHAKKSNLKIKYEKQNLKFLNIKKKYDIILLLEVIEHLDDWKKVVKKCIKNLKPKGRIIFSTINRNIVSRILAIYMAEEVLKWVPKKTHSFEKLIKPKELIKYIEENNLKKIDITGLVFNPLTWEWSLSKNKTKINYFLTAEKN